ncbi:MAG: ribosome maturation factor RimM [Spirochaetaceae bacterium]|jgi:16S rRNA processing protein RimM|nr:ribosome maturation factor RimM [Spirochaetaceae bacterium]
MIEQFVVGHVGQPHGLEGFVKIRSASGEREHLLALKEVLVRGKSGEKTFNIEESRELSGQVLMKFRGIESPEAAKAWSGAALLTGRDQAAPLARNEFYIEELKGLEVVSSARDSRPQKDLIKLGVVSDVVEGGGGWLVEVKLLSGKTQLVPFRKEFFGDIDEAGRTMPLLAEWILE